MNKTQRAFFNLFVVAQYTGKTQSVCLTPEKIAFKFDHCFYVLNLHTFHLASMTDENYVDCNFGPQTIASISTFLNVVTPRPTNIKKLRLVDIIPQGNKNAVH